MGTSEIPSKYHACLETPFQFLLGAKLASAQVPVYTFVNLKAKGSTFPKAATLVLIFMFEEACLFVANLTTLRPRKSLSRRRILLHSQRHRLGRNNHVVAMMSIVGLWLRKKDRRGSFDAQYG